MRCAWHPKYHGYPKIYGIGSWRGRDLEFSDGMCRSCGQRWLAQFRAGRRFGPSEAPPPIIPRWMPRIGVVLALLSAVILAARPVDHAMSARAHPAVAAALHSPSALPGAVPCAATDSAAVQASSSTSSYALARGFASIRRRIGVIPATLSCARRASATSRAIVVTPGCDHAAGSAPLMSTRAAATPRALSSALLNEHEPKLSRAARPV